VTNKLISETTRSEMMRSVRGKDTKPEMLVRSQLHRLGFRYRLHDKMLPGSPDLVFKSKRKVIFVHGCFWHQHCECRHGHAPKSRLHYWTPKLQRNVERDRAALEKLTQMGWSALVVWECELGSLEQAVDRAVRFLDDPLVAQPRKDLESTRLAMAVRTTQ
jgi:DNA mismatch endonuclease (patch repair protein)